MAIELSKRATQVLSGILKGRKLTPHAVARFSEEKVLLQAGCGRTTFIEIEQWLREQDLMLRFSRKLVIPHKSRKARDLLWLAGRHRDLLELMAWKARQRRRREFSEHTILDRVLANLDRSIWAPDRIDADAKEDQSTDLSKRAVAALQVALRKRKVTPAAVAKLDYIKILVQPGIGTKTMNEIELWLARHGLNFQRPRRRSAVILREMQAQESTASCNHGLKASQRKSAQA